MQAFPQSAMTTNWEDATALYTAATHGHIDIVNLLLEIDGSLAMIAKNNGKTALHSAVRMGHIEVVTSLLEMEPGIVCRTDRKGQTALHIALKGQNADIVRRLMMQDNASSIRMQDYRGNTPLHVASLKGNTIVGDFYLIRRSSMLFQLFYFLDSY